MGVGALDTGTLLGKAGGLPFPPEEPVLGDGQLQGGQIGAGVDAPLVGQGQAVGGQEALGPAVSVGGDGQPPPLGHHPEDLVYGVQGLLIPQARLLLLNAQGQEQGAQGGDGGVLGEDGQDMPPLGGDLYPREDHRVAPRRLAHPLNPPGGIVVHQGDALQALLPGCQDYILGGGVELGLGDYEVKVAVRGSGVNMEVYLSEHRLAIVSACGASGKRNQEAWSFPSRARALATAWASASLLK